MGYGLVAKSQAVVYAKAVCDVIGYGSNGTALRLLLETAAAETLLGSYIDPTPYAAGTGLTQVDKGTFNWLREKYRSHPIAQNLHKAFGVSLGKVKYCELENSPLLSFIFCRLRYYVRPEAIPLMIEERAKYWKQHYNTSEGAGSPDEYLERCDLAGVFELLEPKISGD